MKQENKQSSLSTVAALLILAVFAFSVLGVLLTGAQAYKRLTGLGNQSYDSRTGCAYLASRFRQATGIAQVEAFGESDALVFYEQLGGSEYVTRIYCHEGWLMELFCAASGELGPEAGEKILPIRALQLEQQDKLVRIRMEDTYGGVSHLALHSPVEVTP